MDVRFASRLVLNSHVVGALNLQILTAFGLALIRCTWAGKRCSAWCNDHLFLAGLVVCGDRAWSGGACNGWKVAHVIVRRDVLG